MGYSCETVIAGSRKALPRQRSCLQACDGFGSGICRQYTTSKDDSYTTLVVNVNRKICLFLLKVLDFTDTKMVEGV